VANAVPSNGRVALIAGATSELGLATALALRATGTTVVAVGTDWDRLMDVAANHHYLCDLSDPQAVAELADSIHAEVGPVDGLIHLVGGWRAGHDDESWQWLESRLLTTLRNTTSVFRDDLVASSAGRLAIVSSTSVDRPSWANANYSAAKAAAEAWVSAVASGWAKAGKAAAVIFVIRAMGTTEGYTRAETLATRIAALWDTPAAELNGSRINVLY